MQPLWNRHPHYKPQSPLVDAEVNQPLMDPHLKVVLGRSSVAAWALSCGELQSFGRQWYRAPYLDARLLSDAIDVIADLVDLVYFRAC